MDTPTYNVIYNLDDPEGNQTFNHQARFFPDIIYSQTGFTLVFRLKQYDTWDESKSARAVGAFDLTGFSTANLYIKPKNNILAPTSISTGSVSGTPTDGILTFVVAKDTVSNSLAQFTTNSNPTPIVLYFVAESATNQKISLETSIRIMDINRDGNEEATQFNAATLTYTPEQSAKWTGQYWAAPDDIAEALDKLARVDHTDRGSVINQLDTPPGSPTDGDAYLVIATATGDWVGLEDSVVEWNSTAGSWLEHVPREGDEIYDQNGNNKLRYDGAAWGAVIGMTAAEQTKLSHITVTQAVDLDTMESDIATNNAKVTNATHTGDVTGSGALTLESVAITGQTAATPVSGDKFLFSATSDSGNLKECDFDDIGGGSGDMEASTYDPANVSEQLVGLTATQSMTNKTVNGVVLNDGGAATAFLNETGTYSTPAGGGDMDTATYDPANVSEQLVGLTASQSLTNKSVNGVTLSNGGAATSYLDETGSYSVPAGGGGGGSGISHTYTFSTATTATDPGADGVKFDNATPASVTKIYINKDSNGVDISSLIDFLSPDDTIYFQQVDTDANYILAKITSITDNTDWYTIDVSIEDSGTLPGNTETVGIDFGRSSMSLDRPNDETSTSYTLALTDQGRTIWRDNASANDTEIPLNATVDLPVNCVCLIGQKGSGSSTISAASGVDLNGVDGGSFEIGEQYGQVAIVQVAIDKWIINASQSNKYQYLGTSGAISSAASVEFTTAGWFDGTYKELIFVISDVIPATNTVVFHTLFSVDGGSTYLAGTNYIYAGAGRVSNGSNTNINSTGDSKLLIMSGNVGNGSNEALNSKLSLFRPSASLYKFCSFQTECFTSASNLQSLSGGAHITTTSAIDAVKFEMSSGNISSGEILVYGVRT